MDIHLGTAMVRRRVIETDANREGRAIDEAFQVESIRIARLIADALMILFGVGVFAWAFAGFMS